MSNCFAMNLAVKKFRKFFTPEFIEKNSTFFLENLKKNIFATKKKGGNLNNALQGNPT